MRADLTSNHNKIDRVRRSIWYSFSRHFVKSDAAQELLSSELRCRQLLIRWNRERVVSDN